MDEQGEPVVLRGVIDDLEADWAVMVLDDGQRLDWPRERLPQDVSVGDAVVIEAALYPEQSEQNAVGIWVGTVGAQAYTSAVQENMVHSLIQLGDQTLRWPVMRWAVGDLVAVQVKADVDDTQRRRRQVQALLDDLFG